MSFAKEPNAGQTGKQRLHESWALVLGKRGLTFLREHFQGATTRLERLLYQLSSS
jgi:hypothetical protein